MYQSKISTLQPKVHGHQRELADEDVFGQSIQRSKVNKSYLTPVVSRFLDLPSQVGQQYKRTDENGGEEACNSKFQIGKIHLQIELHIILKSETEAYLTH